MVYADVCKVLSNMKDCEEFAGGILKKGTHVAVIHLASMLHDIYKEWNASAKTAQTNIEFLQSAEFKELKIIEDWFLREVQNKMNEMFHQDIHEFLVSSKQFVILIEVLFLFICIILYLFIWTTIVDKFNIIMTEYKDALLLIPLQFIIDLNIRNYFMQIAKPRT